MFSEFIKHLREQDRSEGTVSAYLSDLGIFAGWYQEWAGREMDPAQVVPLDVRAYKRYLVEDRRSSPATVNRKLAALKTFFGWALEKRVVTSDPTTGVHSVLEQENAPRWLDRTEQRNLVRELDIAVQTARTAPAQWRALRDRAIVVLMLHAGLRINEVARAQIADLAVWGKSRTLTVTGKRGKVRQVALNATARKALRAWLDVRDMEPGYLFLSQKGGQIDTSAIYRRIGEYARKAGIDEMTPHSLRHTCAKNLVDQDVPLNYVAAHLGHKRLDTTAIYTRPCQADLARMVELVADEEAA